jgi:hypothetical protein
MTRFWGLMQTRVREFDSLRVLAPPANWVDLNELSADARSFDASCGFVDTVRSIEMNRQ